MVKNLYRSKRRQSYITVYKTIFQVNQTTMLQMHDSIYDLQVPLIASTKQWLMHHIFVLIVGHIASGRCNLIFHHFIT